jgi:hypothetical protein
VDPETIFVIVITAGAVGILAILELKSRRRKATPPPSPQPNDAAKHANDNRRRR